MEENVKICKNVIEKKLLRDMMFKKVIIFAFWVSGQGCPE